MKNLLDKGLAALERRGEKKEERISSLLDRHVDAMADHSTLILYIYVLSGVNLLFWLCVVFFPFEVYRALETVGNLNDRIALLMVGIVFGTGMWLTYALFRIRISDLEDSSFENTFLSSVSHQQKSHRRFHVWLAAVTGGVINLLALFLVELFRIANWNGP